MKPVRIYPFIAALFLLCCGAGVASAAGDAPPAGPPEMVDGYLKIGFDRLGAFPFVGDVSSVTAAASEVQIPAEIKKLNDRKVIVTGFMLPIKMKDERTTEFLLMKNQLLCCYGIAPQVNDWILVDMGKGGALPIMDVPISFRGTLHVGARFENGYLTCIYSLDGEKMIGRGD